MREVFRMKFAVLLLFASFAVAADIPKMPFRDQGACPFECCHYGEWIAESPVVARKSENSKSPVAFRIDVADHVSAGTGVVITKKPGTIRILEEIPFNRISGDSKLGQTKLLKGTLLYTLHLGGEGSARFWLKGRAMWGDLYSETIHAGNADYPWDVLSLPETEWWVKVKNSRGAVGWILDPSNFNGMDDCSG